MPNPLDSDFPAFSSHWLDLHIFNQHAIAKQSTFNRRKIEVAIMLALCANRNAISVDIQSILNQKIEGCSLPTFNRSHNANAAIMLRLRAQKVSSPSRVDLPHSNDARSAAALAKLAEA